MTPAYPYPYLFRLRLRFRRPLAFRGRDGRFMILDLVGKRGRVRSIPMPRFAKQAIDAYAKAARLTDGLIFRSVNRWDQIQYDHLSPQAVRRVVAAYGHND